MVDWEDEYLVTDTGTTDTAAPSPSVRLTGNWEDKYRVAADGPAPVEQLQPAQQQSQQPQQAVALTSQQQEVEEYQQYEQAMKQEFGLPDRPDSSKLGSYLKWSQEDKNALFAWEEAEREIQREPEYLDIALNEKASNEDRFAAAFQFYEQHGDNLESTGLWWTQSIPIGGSILQGMDAVAIIRAANRIKDGKPRKQDFMKLAHAKFVAEESGDRSTWGKIADILIQMPAFAGEIALTGGAFTGAKKIAEKVALRGMGKLGVRQALKAGAGRFAKRRALNAAGMVAGSLAIGAANPARIGATAAERMVPEFGLKEDEAGQWKLAIGEDFRAGGAGDNLLTAITYGWLDTSLEMGSEMMGGHMLAGIAKGLGPMAKPAIQAWNKMPKSSKLAGIRAGLAKVAMKLKPSAKVDDFFKKVAYHGPVGEFGEERLVDFWGGVIDSITEATGLPEFQKGDRQDFGMLGDVAAGRWGEVLEQVFVEAVAFSIPAIGGQALSVPGNIQRQKQVAASELLRMAEPERQIQGDPAAFVIDAENVEQLAEDFVDVANDADVEAVVADRGRTANALASALGIDPGQIPSRRSGLRQKFVKAVEQAQESQVERQAAVPQLQDMARLRQSLRKLKKADLQRYADALGVEPTIAAIQRGVEEQVGRREAAESAPVESETAAEAIAEPVGPEVAPEAPVGTEGAVRPEQPAPKRKFGQKKAEAAAEEADIKQAAAERESEEGPQPSGFGLGRLAPLSARQRADKIQQSEELQVVEQQFPEQVRQLDAARGRPSKSLLTSAGEIAKSGFRKATRAQEHIPNTAEFAVANDSFRKLKDVASRSQDTVARRLGAIVDDLGPGQKRLFELSLIMDNLADSVARGEPRRFGFESKEQISDFHGAIQPMVDATSEVKKAVETRRQVVEELVTELVEYNLLPADALERVGTYFHQDVLAHVQLDRGTMAGALKTIKRGFQKRRVTGVEEFGEELNYNTDYLEAEYDWMVQAEIELAKEKLLRRIDEQYGILGQLEAQAAEESKEGEPVTWKDLLRGNPGYAVWQPAEGNVFFRALSVTEDIARKFEEGILEDADLTQDQLKEVLAMGGPKRQFVLPVEIVNQLESMDAPKNSRELTVVKGYRQLYKAWKAYILNNPKNIVGYSLRNITGDLDPVIGSAPGAVTQVGKAARDLYRYYYGKRLIVPKDLQGAIDEGVLDSSFQAQEIPNLKDLPMFERFFQDSVGSKMGLGLVKDYFAITTKFQRFREAILRLSVYRHTLERLNAGKPVNYGGSKRSIIKALQKDLGNETAAAHLARNLLGDYGDATVMGEWLRQNAIPFYMWMEVNAKRYPKMFANAVIEGTETGNLSAVALHSAMAMSRVGAVYALMWLWNHIVWPDEEDDLGVYDKENPHIVTGRNPDGTVRVLRNTGALGDFLEWFGINTALSLLPKVRAGQISTSELIAEMAKDPINKMVSGVRPDVKAAIEVPTGQSAFPDVFNPRRQERGEIASSVVGLRDEYRAAKGLILQEGERARPHYLTRFTGQATVDPRKNALYEIYDLRERFQKKRGEGSMMRGDSHFRNMRESAIAENYEAFKEGRTTFLAKGKEYKNFKASLANLDPIASRLNDEDEVAFEQEFLTDRQRDKLRAARDFAGQLRVTMWLWWKRAAEEGGAEEATTFGTVEHKEVASKYKTLRQARPTERTKTKSLSTRTEEWLKERETAAKWLQDRGY